jgi:5-hydroxyisourate hydrolase-like protein (transthyretin family)
MRAFGPTVLRVFLGVVFVMHAYLALVIYTPAGAAAYNAKLGIPLPEPAFIDDVTLDFGVADAAAHCHVPLLVSPYGYSTYRGS